MYVHFQKTRELAQGEGKIILSVDIHCMGHPIRWPAVCALNLTYCSIEIYGKGALDGHTLDVKRAHAMHTFT